MTLIISMKHVLLYNINKRATRKERLWLHDTITYCTYENLAIATAYSHEVVAGYLCA